MFSHKEVSPDFMKNSESNQQPNQSYVVILLRGHRGVNQSWRKRFSELASKLGCTTQLGWQASLSHTIEMASAASGLGEKMTLAEDDLELNPYRTDWGDVEEDLMNDQRRRIALVGMKTVFKSLMSISEEERSEKERAAIDALSRLIAHVSKPTVSPADMDSTLDDFARLSLDVDVPEHSSEIAWSSGSSRTSSIHDVDVCKFSNIVEGPVEGVRGGHYIFVEAKKSGRRYKRYITKRSLRMLSPEEQELVYTKLRDTAIVLPE